MYIYQRGMKIAGYILRRIQSNASGKDKGNIFASRQQSIK